MASERFVSGDEVPPRGWEAPRGADAPTADADELLELARQLLALVPDELRARLIDAAKALLEALRALIDWVAARIEQRADGAVEVRDIPIL